MDCVERTEGATESSEGASEAVLTASSSTTAGVGGGLIAVVALPSMLSTAGLRGVSIVGGPRIGARRLGASGSGAAG